MSTATETPSRVSSWGMEENEAQPRPQLYVSGRITGLGECKTSGGGDGYYEMVDIIIEPTRGSSRVPKGRLMFRPEMFSPAFKKAVYGRNEEDGSFTCNPKLNFVPQGSKTGKTAGETFLTVYRMNVSPDFYVRKSDGVLIVKNHTALTAISGGSSVSWTEFVQAMGQFQSGIPEDRAPDELGLVSPTSEEIVDFLKSYVSSHRSEDQIFHLTQQRNKDGELTDFYQVNNYLGVLTGDLANRIRDRVAKTQTEPVGKRFKIGFQL